MQIAEVQTILDTSRSRMHKGKFWLEQCTGLSRDIPLSQVHWLTSGCIRLTQTLRSIMERSAHLPPSFMSISEGPAEPLVCNAVVLIRGPLMLSKMMGWVCCSGMSAWSAVSTTGLLGKNLLWSTSLTTSLPSSALTARSRGTGAPLDLSDRSCRHPSPFPSLLD